MASMKDCCCGVDVHKSFIVAVIAKLKGKDVIFSGYTRFSTFKKGLLEFKAWLGKHDCYEICMESTGKYYIPVYRTVADETFHVDVVHPKYVKAPRGKKNDKKDAKRIADMYMRDHIAEYSIIPTAEILAIRDVARYRRKTVYAITAEKNRMSNCLTVSGIKLDEVLSDLYGKTGQALIAETINRGGCDFNPEPFIDKRVKATPEEFREALDGDITPATLIKMKMIQERMEFLCNQKAELELSMASLSKDFNRQLEILDSAPGIDSISAISILSEIGSDMKVFGSIKKCLSWVGVVPQNDESAGKKKSTRIAKGNSWLKPVLVQCANAAIKDKKHPEIREKYLAIKKRRGHGKAIIAIAKRLMTAIYFMLLRDQMYAPCLGKDTAPKRGKISLERLIAHYQSQGYTITSKGLTVPAFCDDSAAS